MTGAPLSAFIVAGVQSGVGKTSVTLGLCRAFWKRGLRVQSFKTGPDYLDPTHLARASGRPCYNLDTWMSTPTYATELLRRQAAQSMQDAPGALVIEGAMGLFDGADPGALAGSTAHMAALLKVPVLLVLDAKGMAGSVAALVKGYAEFHPDVQIIGVIANRCGSERHVAILREALAAAHLPPLLGAIPADGFPRLTSRHLGLLAADADGMDSETLDAFGRTCLEHINLDALLEITHAPALAVSATPLDETPIPVRLGIARDKAFHFYYADTLDAYNAHGARLVPFSPLEDGALPPDLDGLLLGGGYPESHAQDLADNGSLREQIKAFSQAGHPIHAECGGLMYLGRSLRVGEMEYPMVGVFPYRTRLCERRKRLGYTEVTQRVATPFGPAGLRLRGHEFHFSEIMKDDANEPAREAVYDGVYRRGETGQDGWIANQTLASYTHLHLASHPEAIRSFLLACKESSCPART